MVRQIPVPGPAELGRQGSLDETVDSCRRAEGRWRVVIAGREAKTVARCFFLVEPQEGGSFNLTNLHEKFPVELSDGREVVPRSNCLIDSSVLIVAANRRLRLQSAGPRAVLQGLDEATVPPGEGSLAPLPLSGALAAPVSVEVEALLRWLQSALDVLQSAATSSDFFARAARALVEVVCLDLGVVLLRRAGNWEVQATHRAPHAPAIPERDLSQHILERVLRERRTFWETPDAAPGQAASLEGIETVVAAPLLDRQGAVIGALYGDRRQDSGTTGRPMTRVEAKLVELLGRGVAAGLARLEQEQKALAAQVRFEQFFTRELAHRLINESDLLRGRDAEVTILFCDVRGFSRVSEQLKPEATMDWLGDVLDELSACVGQHQGVLVDYVGDELLAMWGAPAEQPDHATRACRAALDMLACLPGLDERWQTKVGAPTALGIGINTGVARVGNTGSKSRFKYGPLGHTVNLASRVQGATKHLQCRLLITSATEAKLNDSFARRRLCRVRVVNIETPVDLYELAPAQQPGWAEARSEYEQALAEFEQQQFRASALRLAGLHTRRPDDGPALVLLSRAVRCMVEGPSCDPVWVLPSK
jgi:adenylate cyclase